MSHGKDGGMGRKRTESVLLGEGKREGQWSGKLPRKFTCREAN